MVRGPWAHSFVPQTELGSSFSSTLTPFFVFTVIWGYFLISSLLSLFAQIQLIHIWDKTLYFSAFIYTECLTPSGDRYTESRLLPAVWDEEALGNLLSEVIVFCSSSTFLQITGIVKLSVTEDSHLPRPRRGSLPLYRIWWTEGWLWLALMSCRVNFRAGERKLQTETFENSWGLYCWLPDLVRCSWHTALWQKGLHCLITSQKCLSIKSTLCEEMGDP